MSDPIPASADRIFLVAGEPSGDVLGAALMQALVRRRGAGIGFSGVGGPRMADEGLASLFPMADIAVMGIGPVLARLPSIFARIDRTARAIIAAPPDVLVLIDSPDFTHRVARRVRKVLPDLPIVVYVSPTVWFWRPGRAKKLAQFCTRLMALLPFEPAVHAVLGGPPTSYVGHPFTTRLAELERLRAADDGGPRDPAAPPRLLVLPGSRRSEVTRLLAIFGETLGLLVNRIGPVVVTIPVVEHVRAEVEAGIAHWPVRPELISGEAAKLAAFAGATAALAASGTATLELALSHVPTVAAYRLDWIGRRAKHFLRPPQALTGLLTVRSAQLANVILDEKVIPEFIDEQCTPAALAAALAPLVQDSDERRRQLAAFDRLDRIMRPTPDYSPADEAAAVVLDVLAGASRRG